LCGEIEGRGGSAAKQVPPQPGTIPALGLRAGAMVFSFYRRPALERRKIMLFSSWLRNWKSSAPAPRRRTQTSRRQRASFCPRLEALEERTVPSGYQQINLVSYQPGLGHFTDPNLNGWGMTSLPDGSFVVSNTFTTGLATSYDRSGHVLPQKITVPGSTGGSAFLGLGPGGHPTGVVYNPTNDFVITNPDTHVCAPATLIFDSIDGTISGWNPVVDPTDAILIHDTWKSDGTDSVYTGLEIGQDSNGNNVLYAADFLHNKLEVINKSFTTINTIPCDGLGVSNDSYSWVWSVQAVKDKLYVTFADLFNPSGGGGGAVDVFDTDGNPQYQLDANGPGPGRLQNPWGITQAPANFGAFSNDLLVGNVAGKGNINVYDPDTYQWLGQLRQPNGDPIEIKGLWDLEFGDGTPHGGKTNHLFFDAGPNHPGDNTGGLFGVIHAAGDQGDDDGGDAGATEAQLAQVRQVLVSIPVLPASYLGEEAGNQVWISSNAAGGGWNLGASTLTGQMDVRSVLDHEFGHVLGMENSDNLHDVMGETLAAGTQSVALAPTADPLWTW
jgi:uncharacterized protein (TIGR03118 family)